MILTDEEIADICCDIALKTSCDIAYARAIEAAIMEKIGEPIVWMGESGGIWAIPHEENMTPLYAIKKTK